MILDAHCQFWVMERGDYGWLDGVDGALAPIRRDFLPSDYPATARLIAVQAAPTLPETEFLLSLAKGRDAVAGVIGWVDLSAADSAGVLRRLAANPKLRGIRAMLQDIRESDWIVTAPRPETIAALRELDLSLEVMVTPRHLPALTVFARANPGLRLMIGHAGKPRLAIGPDPGWIDGMSQLARLPSVCCKLSGMLTELGPGQLTAPLPELRRIVDRLLDWFGPDRLIWGSDWPVLTLSASYQDWLALTEALLESCSCAERAAIMGGNAARFYRLG